MATVSSKEVELLKKSRLTFGEKAHLTWKRMKDNKVNYFLILPFLIFFLLFTIIPVLSSIVLSFTRYDILNAPVFVGWDNYLRMFLEDEVFLIALKNTFQFAVITDSCFVFSLFRIRVVYQRFAAYCQSDVYRYLLRTDACKYLLYIPVYFQRRYVRTFKLFLIQFGLINEPIQWLTNTDYMLNIVIFVQLWCSLGTGFLAFVAGLQNLDPSLVEAGAIDGIRNRFQELIYIILPQMGGSLMFGAVMQISQAFSVGGISSALVGFPSIDYAAHTIVLHISDFGNTRFELGYASALSVVLFAIMLGIKGIVNRLLRRFSHD